MVATFGCGLERRAHDDGDGTVVIDDNAPPGHGVWVQRPRACTQDSGGPSTLRRLTREQYVGATRALLGLTTSVAETFLPDERTGPFAANATAPVTTLGLEKLQQAAEDLADQAMASLPALMGCDVAEEGRSCVTAFVQTFGERAYRRPLTSAEQDALLELYGTGSNEQSAQEGVRWVLEAMLQSPHFLYVVELGQPAADNVSPGMVRLSPFELATRLSLLLWNNVPDKALLEAARTGELATAQGRQVHAQRLMADPQAMTALQSFHEQWLQLYDLSITEKSLEGIAFNDALREEMQADFRGVIAHVFADDAASFDALFTSAVAYPGPQLANIYNVPMPEQGQPANMQGRERYGVLTQPAVLSVLAHRDRTSPVHRGIMVRQNFFCQELAPPPPGVSDSLPRPSAEQTEEDVLRTHREDPACAGCHNLIDPLGFAFERYDAVGRLRDNVNSTGDIIQTDVDRTIAGMADLVQALRESDQVRRCYANQWSSFVLGRKLDETHEACALQTMEDALAHGGDVRALLLAFVASDAFASVSLQGQDP